MAARLELTLFWYRPHCFCCVKQVVLMLTRCIYMTKTMKSVSKQSQLQLSLLCSRFLGCHATLPPKKRLLTSKHHSFPFVSVVCLRSVEQTNHIKAKWEWRKLSRKKACGANTRGICGFCFMPHITKNRRCSWATTMTDEKKKVNESPKYKCFMCSSLCSANKRIYIFWKCQIVSVNQGLNASYRLKSGGKRTKSGIQNSLSTNQAKLLDFLIPLLS